MVRIICIGNRFAYPDNFGILIYDILHSYALKDIELVEGGVGGTSLASYFEDNTPILIVDFGSEKMPKIITNKEIEALQIDEFNHSNAFLYFLKSIEKEYLIYLCREDFTKEDLAVYAQEIVTLAKEMQ